MYDIKVKSQTVFTVDITFYVFGEFIYLLSMCGHVLATVLMWRLEDRLLESVLSVYRVGSADRTQVVGFDSKHFLPTEPSWQPAIHILKCY